MAYRCDKCRTEYSSGSHYGGHDYCMACYIQLKQTDERKRRDAELKIQRQVEERRLLERKRMEKEMDERQQSRNRMLSDEYRKLDMKVVDWREEEIKRQRELRQARMQKLYDEQDRKRRMQQSGAQESQQQAVEPAHNKLHGASKKGSPGPLQAGYLPGARRHEPAPRAVAQPAEFHGFAAQLQEPTDDVSLELRAQAGLPVSLSVGQKGIVVVFVGKNTSKKTVVAQLHLAVSDSKKNQLQATAQPSHCAIESGGEKSFEVKFDLKEETALGPLSLSAYLSENAIYVDRETAKSPPVLLHSQVKTPLSLAYKKGSATIRTGKGADRICLAFDNLGESGGILSTHSSVKYGGKGSMATAPLEAPAKVKGLQKNLRLCFSPAQGASLEHLVSMLVGVDANGKAYQERKTISEKKK